MENNNFNNNENVFEAPENELVASMPLLLGGIGVLFFICSCFINRSGEWSLIYNAGCLVGIGLLVLGVCMVIIRGISETEKSKSIIVYILMVVMILVMFFKGKGMYEDYKNGTEEITIVSFYLENDLKGLWEYVIPNYELIGYDAEGNEYKFFLSKKDAKEIMNAYQITVDYYSNTKCISGYEINDIE